MPDLYTFVAHQELAFANPFSEATMDRAIALLGAECLATTPRASVIDFGAGFCELPIRLAERFGSEVVAVELGARMASLARERIRVRLLERSEPLPFGGVTVHEGDAGRFRAQIADRSFDAGVCIGSSHALGGFGNMLDVLARLVRPRGCVLLGEGFWESPPDPAALARTPVGQDEFATLPALLDDVHASGLRPLWVVSATPREWDEYEWTHQRTLERFAADRPDEPDAKKLLVRGRAWRETYTHALRGKLGFVLVLARRIDTGGA